MALQAMGNVQSIIQAPFDGTNSSQQWYRFETGGGFFNIVSVCNGLCVDLRGAVTEPGTEIWQDQKQGTESPQWQIVRVQIKETLAHNGKYL